MTQILGLFCKEYIDTFQDLIDSVGEPRTSQFKEVFMFLGNDEITNLSSLHTFGILEEEYNITRSEDLNTEKNRSKIKDYKGVKTTTILKDIFDSPVNIGNIFFIFVV